MMDDAEKRGQLIRHLEDALTLADEIRDGHTGYLIERALDEARAPCVVMAPDRATDSRPQLRGERVECRQTDM
jgi:hypothetical protein